MCSLYDFQTENHEFVAKVVGKNALDYLQIKWIPGKENETKENGFHLPWSSLPESLFPFVKLFSALFLLPSIFDIVRPYKLLLYTSWFP